VAVLLTSLTVAKEWERGQMEQLFATPVSRLEVVLGKLLPYLVIGCLQALLVLSVGMGVFDVPIKGSPLLLALATLLFMIGMLGLGLFLSVVTRNQMLATMAASMTTILPTLLLSGFLYPISNMPQILQVLSLIFPARYFMTILRGLLLKGSSFSDLWPHYLGLTVFAIAIVAAARARFVRRIA
jgi:ABC-2 type transport system permease protein